MAFGSDSQLFHGCKQTGYPPDFFLGCHLAENGHLYRIKFIKNTFDYQIEIIIGGKSVIY